jgi:hypothetical protein
VDGKSYEDAVPREFAFDEVLLRLCNALLDISLMDMAQ